MFAPVIFVVAEDGNGEGEQAALRSFLLAGPELDAIEREAVTTPQLGLMIVTMSETWTCAQSS